MNWVRHFFPKVLSRQETNHPLAPLLPALHHWQLFLTTVVLLMQVDRAMDNAMPAAQPPKFQVPRWIGEFKARREKAVSFPTVSSLILHSKRRGT